MLRISLFTVILGLILPLLHSCGKYPDGPNFTLLSRKSRLEGTWTAYEVTNSNGQTTSYPNGGASIELTDDEEVFLYTGIITIQGTWSLVKDKEYLRITYPGLSSTEYEIRRLKNKDMWLKDPNGSLTKYEKIDD